MSDWGSAATFLTSGIAMVFSGRTFKALAEEKAEHRDKSAAPGRGTPTWAYNATIACGIAIALMGLALFWVDAP
ncbi:hypothetical protein [Mycobacteroides abscessus]|uniref:hypothetical protein n=1 Tax=Mycobacteroides abscessus TaxID=36809 RepID=UPI0013000F81|nr:hypothetical protein [Mycobacteroides abscessus]